jgi:DNA-binding CsgD family transcriptional regulator
MDENAIERALDACYDSVVDPGSWADALHALARAVDSAACLFYPREAPTTVAVMPASPDYHDLLQVYVRDRWYENHYRAERGWPQMHHGRTIIEHDLATDEERRRFRTYNDLYLKFGFPGFAAIGFSVEGHDWCLPLVRGNGQGHFTRDEAERLAQFAPHLRRMVSLTEKLAGERVKSGLDLLDRMAAAALVLNWRGIVVRANAQAEVLLGHDLAVEHGRLAARDRESDRRLQALVAAALAVRHAREFPAPPTAIARPGQRPLMVEAMPVSGLFGDVFLHARVLVLITDLEARPQTSEERLQAVLGLSPAEARLVAQLGLGDELGDIADRLGITRETARSQVKSAFAKTATHRQVELISLAARVGAAPKT